MFLVKSAFWLTIAYIAIHPNAGDLADAAQSASSRAFAAGQQLIVSQIVRNPCLVAACGAPEAVAAQTPTATPVTRPSTETIAPVPRPRPRGLG